MPQIHGKWKRRERGSEYKMLASMFGLLWRISFLALQLVFLSRSKRIPKHLSQQQVSPLPSSPNQLMPTAAHMQWFYHSPPWEGAGPDKMVTAWGWPLRRESQGSTCHCCRRKAPCSSLPALMALAVRTLLTKETLPGSSHESPTARVSGNWGELGRTRVCPKTKWDRRLPLLGNLSVCSRDWRNKDLHMVILARTGRFRLSFSTPWKWPPKMCMLEEHLF